MWWFAAGMIACSGEPLAGLNEIGGDGAFEDDRGELAPWAEVFNAGSSPVSLEGWVFSHDGTAWVAPALMVEAGGLQVLWLDGQVEQSDAHTSFVMSDQGGLITVVDADGQALQEVRIPPLAVGSSFGRLPDGAANWQVIDDPSPGERNTTP